MRILVKTFQALTFIFIGNVNLLLVAWVLDKLTVKGLFPLFVFLPCLFVIIAMKLLIYDSFYGKIENMKNKAIRVTLILLLSLLTLFVAIALQSGIYYCHYYYTTKMSS